MKILAFIVHESVKQNILDLLGDVKGIRGCFLTDVEGYFEETGTNPYETSMDLIRGFTPRVKIKIFIEDEYLDQAIEQLTRCTSCVKGKGWWYVKTISGLHKL